MGGRVPDLLTVLQLQCWIKLLAAATLDIGQVALVTALTLLALRVTARYSLSRVPDAVLKYPSISSDPLTDRAVKVKVHHVQYTAPIYTS